MRRRRLLGLPIGTFIFLVAAGCWTRTELFWWPVAGLDGIAARPLPEFDRPAAVLIGLELLGMLAVVWLIRRFELGRSANRRQLLATGRRFALVVNHGCQSVQGLRQPLLTADTLGHRHQEGVPRRAVRRRRNVGPGVLRRQWLGALLDLVRGLFVEG